MSPEQSLRDAADRALGTGEGAEAPSPGPRGRNRKRPDATTRNAWRAGQQKRREREKEEREQGPAPISEGDIQICTTLGKTVWAIVGKMLGLRELNREEAVQLGGAIAPVMQKWSPALGEWMPEANLALVVAALYFQTRGESDAEDPENRDDPDDE